MDKQNLIEGLEIAQRYMAKKHPFLDDDIDALVRDSLGEAIALLTAQPSDSLDAARYRFLRDNLETRTLGVPYACVRGRCGSGYASYSIDGEDLDAATDDELSKLVKNQTTLVENLEQLIEKERLLKARYANGLLAEYAALEAESAKPRMWMADLNRLGQIVGVSRKISHDTFCIEIKHNGDGYFRVPVREVKPVIVDSKMVESMYRAWMDAKGLATDPYCWVVALKAAGIDAVAAE
jgi:hypothetical protein